VEANQAVYERDAEIYSDLSLMPAEQAVLSLLGDHWPKIEMLDVGVGTGRTAYTFAAVAGRYVGIDYSPRMIELARRLLDDSDGRVELSVGDARDLAPLGGSFDFILFSYNGLDSVSHEDRLKILTEFRRVLKPDGHFFFSSHSMNALPLKAQRPRGKRRSRLHAAYSWARYARRLRRARKVNKELDLDAGRQRGWMIVRDGAHGFELRVYYVDPSYQLEQLREAGFETIAIYDGSGRRVEVEDAGGDPWLHYLCRPA